MAKISLAWAVSGASLETQQNTNNEAYVESLYSSAQHYTLTTLCKARFNTVPTHAFQSQTICLQMRYSEPNILCIYCFQLDR
jgi:hypothetical protein